MEKNLGWKFLIMGEKNGFLHFQDLLYLYLLGVSIIAQI